MPAAPTARTLPLAGQSQTETDNEQWVEPIRWVALAVFVVLPVFAFFVQRFAGRVVWTVMIAALPLFIVLIGYHRWRRICPLAFFSQIPVMLRRPGTLKASEWLERNYYYVSFAVFFFSLWLRLIATNGSGASISIFFIISRLRRSSQARSTLARHGATTFVLSLSSKRFTQNRTGFAPP